MHGQVPPTTTPVVPVDLMAEMGRLHRRGRHHRTPYAAAIWLGTMNMVSLLCEECVWFSVSGQQGGGGR